MTVFRQHGRLLGVIRKPLALACICCCPAARMAVAAEVLLERGC